MVKVAIPEFAGHQLAKSKMQGFGDMLTIEVKGGGEVLAAVTVDQRAGGGWPGLLVLLTVANRPILLKNSPF